MSSYDPEKLNRLLNRGFFGQSYYDRNIGFSRDMYDITDILFGYRSYRDNLAKNQVQIDYNQYMKNAYERKLADWNKNVPNRSIRYPELAMAGSIASYDAGISSANYSNDIVGSNYAGSHLYRGMGLYGIAGRLSRSM